MNCPKCGAVIPDGSLYCENCGEDIHIVPDFEPEIESSIKETLNSLIENIAGEENPLQEPDTEAKVRQTKPIKENKFVLIVGTVCVTLLILGIIGISIYFQRYNSLDYQMGRAAQCLAEKQYEEAIGYYERALLLDDKDISIKFMLADVYYTANRKNDAVSMLFEIIYTGNSSESVSEEELLKAYTKLIHIYEEQENYMAIRDLLNECTNTDIFVQFQEYSAKEPGFSYEEGIYDTVIPLKLTATTNGTIYYTTDGMVPTKDSEVYTTPIFLETGNYTISAVFVNQFGISSEVVSKKYQIEVLRPCEPEISVESGEYNYPMMISIDVLEGYEVYYTTDGTDPTENSVKYNGPIPMPLGSSTFRFIMYDENNLPSDVVTRNFKLELFTEITPEKAVNQVLEALVIRGKIYDFNGNSYETDGKYRYLFQYAVTIENAGDFYVIAEAIEDDTGARDRTGTNYAVNVYTGEYYKLYIDEDGSYRLESF